jgi:hypothetical protein
MRSLESWRKCLCNTLRCISFMMILILFYSFYVEIMFTALTSCGNQTEAYVRTVFSYNKKLHLNGYSWQKYIFKVSHKKGLKSSWMKCSEAYYRDTSVNSLMTVQFHVGFPFSLTTSSSVSNLICNCLSSFRFQIQVFLRRKCITEYLQIFQAPLFEMYIPWENSALFSPKNFESLRNGKHRDLTMFYLIFCKIRYFSIKFQISITRKFQSTNTIASYSIFSKEICTTYFIV